MCVCVCTIRDARPRSRFKRQCPCASTSIPQMSDKCVHVMQCAWRKPLIELAKSYAQHRTACSLACGYYQCQSHHRPSQSTAVIYQQRTLLYTSRKCLFAADCDGRRRSTASSSSLTQLGWGAGRKSTEIEFYIIASDIVSIMKRALMLVACRRPRLVCRQKRFCVCVCVSPPDPLGNRMA